MKALTKFITATVAAASLASFAAPALASHVIATSTYLPPLDANSVQIPDFVWTNNGVTGAGAGGTLTGSASGLNDFFSFNVASMLGANFIPADFLFNATSTGGPATLGVSGTWTQPGLTGSFSFTYNGPTMAFGGHTIFAGSNLLSGTFTDAWIQGAGGSGSTNVAIGNGGTACFASAYFATSCSPTSNSEFSFNLLAVNPGFGADAGKGLNSFTAVGSGVFSVPEPGTWALMIMGFGGVGALVRSRRRQAAFA